MQIFASVKGRFVEPVTPGATVRDVVSYLQLEAHSAQETHILRDLYMILQRGGVIAVGYDEDGLTVDTQSMGPEKPPVGDSAREVATPVVTLPSIESALEAEPSAEVSPADLPHEHQFQEKHGYVADGAASWLKCACGEWSYFGSQSALSVGLNVTERGWLAPALSTVPAAGV